MTTSSFRAGSGNTGGPTGTALSTVTVTPGSNAVAGDVLYIAIRLHKTTDPGAVGALTGWTKILENYDLAANSGRDTVYRRVADGTETNSYVLSWSVGSSVVWAYAAYKDGAVSPIDATSSIQTNTASTTPGLPSATTTAANDLAVGILLFDAATSTTSNAGTSGFNIDVSAVNANVACGGIAIGSKAFAGIGAIGAYAYGLSASKVSEAVTDTIKAGSGGGGGGTRPRMLAMLGAG